MRPALGRHSGIPQITRLLFRGLRLLDGVDVAGLIQTNQHALVDGLPADAAARAAMPVHEQFDRLSRVVVSITNDVLSVRRTAVSLALRHLMGGSEPLGRFDAVYFRDFLWRFLFARTLEADDFDTVMGAEFRVASMPWSKMHQLAMITRPFGYALYPRLDTSGFDVMIAETPYPGTVSPATRLVVHYHDAIPLMMPHTIADTRDHQASHYHALCRNVADGAYFVCVSEATRNDLLAVFPELEARSRTIHNMVSHHYYREQSTANIVPLIVRTRLSDRLRDQDKRPIVQLRPGTGEPMDDYLLIVSTVEPRKNHATLLAAWEQLKTQKYPDLRLIVVGMIGWEHEPIVKDFRPWMEQGQLYVLENVPSPELRVLYHRARATVCPSFGEGFDLSGVEAMRCGGCIAASDIPVHREIYGDAAEYFSPYSPAGAAAAIDSIIASDRLARREELIRLGDEISRRYTPENILPHWQEFLRAQVNGKSGN